MMSWVRTERWGFAADILLETAKNTAMGIPWVRDRRLRRPRAGATFVDRDEVIERYAFQSLRSALRYRGSIDGCSIVEFGPGDTLASGISLLAGGAETYAALDRFVPDYSAPAAKAWYRGIERAWPRFHERPWPPWLDAANFPDAYPDRVAHLKGSVEEAQTDRRFDLVCSFQVGEHVYDVNRFASLTADLLAPHGLAIHRVDFGPHDCWLRYRDPLTFLRIPPRLWSAMGSNRGTPNRVRHHEFLRAFADAGLAVEAVDRARYPSEAIDIGRLHHCVRQSPQESLLTENVVYLCRLP